MRAIIFSTLTALLLSPSAFASYDRGKCELKLTHELLRRPDDSNQGMVTDRLPISVPMLLEAYRHGIFPWYATDDGRAVWHNPPLRGVLAFDKIHISTKDRKFIERELNGHRYQVTFDQAFREVIEECAKMVRWKTDPLTGQKIIDGQWISPHFIENYVRLHEAGNAHSVEVWHDGILVAGLYGTFVGGVFAGESMFHKEDDATKLALYALVERLKSQGHRFIDTQQAKGLVAKWGAELVERQQFMGMLSEAQSKNLPF